MRATADDQGLTPAATPSRACRGFLDLSATLIASVLMSLAVLGVFAVPASAFRGEPLVIIETPSGPTLTPPAETIIRNPTFLQEADEVAEEAVDKPGPLSRIIGGGGGLPRWAKVIPWVGTAFTVNEICNAIFDACIQIGGGTDPPRGTITWSYAEQSTTEYAWGGYLGAPVTPYTVPAGHYYAGPYTFNETIDSNCASPNRPYPLVAATAEIDVIDANCNDGAPNPPWGRADERIVLRSEYANRAIVGSGPDTEIPNAPTTSAYCPSFGPGPLSCSSTPTGNWESRVASALAGESSAMGLTGLEVAQLGEYIAHEIDPRCQPNPYSSTVDVPAILPDETSAHYQDCLETLGLGGDLVTLNATDTTAANGAVLTTHPEPGSNVSPQSEVQIAVNPPQANGTERNEKCEQESGGRSDPGEPPSDGSGYPYYQHVEGSPYPVSVDPSGSPSPVSMMPLRWGMEGLSRRWGWRHIKAEHGYGPWDRAQTEAALLSDTTPSPTGWISTNQWDYHSPFTADDGAGGTVQCKRTVRVEFWTPQGAQIAGLTGIRGIQNSFVGKVIAGS